MAKFIKLPERAVSKVHREVILTGVRIFAGMTNSFFSFRSALLNLESSDSVLGHLKIVCKICIYCIFLEGRSSSSRFLQRIINDAKKVKNH